MSATTRTPRTIRTLTDAAKAAKAARKAQALLDASRPASADHPYIARKQITPLLSEIDLADAIRILHYPPKSDDVPLQGRLLLVPVYIDGALSTCELIGQDGRKSAIAGGRKGGGYWSTAPLPDCDWLGDLTIIVAEGMATVVSASMATGHLGVAALTCGNLLAVAKMLRGRYSDAKIILVADLGNGQSKAIEAAQAVAGFVAVPDFGENPPEGAKDINDLHQVCGLEAVRASIESATKPAPAEPVTEAINAELLPAREYGFSESEAARRFGDQIRDRARFAADDGVWYCYAGTRWVKDHAGVGMLEQSLEVSLAYAQDGIRLGSADPQFQFYMETAKRYNGLAGRKRLIELVRAEPGLAILSSQFDADPWVLNVENGTIDLKTGRLRPHCAGDLITKLVPVIYDPAALAPLWERCLPQWLADGETVGYFQRAFGYSFTGDVTEHVAFFVYGPAAGGKTVIVETGQALLGDYATLAPTSLLLAKQGGESHPCDRMVLRGVRMAVFTEMPSGQRWDLPTFKSLTGGDTVTGRGMRENFSTFRPTAKLWIVGNHRPIVTDQDESPWRRIRVVPVERAIPEKDRDPELAQKLRAELPGILAWGIRGCVAWQRERLGQSARVQTATGAYRLDSDVLAPFVSERCTVGPQVVVTRTALYRAYVEWSETQHTRPLSDRAFAEAVRGRRAEDCQIRANGKPARAWRGIGLAEYTVYTRQDVLPVDGLESSHKDLTGESVGNVNTVYSPPAPTDAPSAAGVLGNCTRVRPDTTVTPAEVQSLAEHLAGPNGTAQATLDKLWSYWKASPSPSVAEFLAAERKRALHA